MPLKLYQRPNGYYYIRGTVQGRRVDESARTRIRSEAEALRAHIEADLFKRAVYGDKSVATFAEAVEAYLLGGGSADHLNPLLDRIGLRKLAEIDQTFVDRLAREMKPTGKPSTLIRQVYTPVSAVMNFAARSKLCDPVQFIKPEVRNARLDFLTPAQTETVLGELPDHLRGLVTFYLGTGCRASEALNLDWKDISPEAERMVLWDTKNGHARAVDLQQRVRDALPPRGEGRVWRNSYGEPWHAYDAINLMLKRHVKSRPVHCHLFRHTWATWAYACTRDLTFLMQQGGWRSASMVLRYAHAGSDDLGRAVLEKGWEFFGREVIVLPRKPKRPRKVPK